MGRIISVLCAAILLVLGASAAVAQEWTFFYEREEQKYYFDKAGLVRPDKNFVRVTEKVTKKGEIGEDEKPIETDIARSEYEINCRNRSFKALSYTQLDTESGKEIPAEQSAPPSGRALGVFTYDRLGALYENICP
jgi:hypothetical protein